MKRKKLSFNDLGSLLVEQTTAATTPDAKQAEVDPAFYVITKSGDIDVAREGNPDGYLTRLPRLRVEFAGKKKKHWDLQRGNFFTYEKLSPLTAVCGEYSTAAEAEADLPRIQEGMASLVRRVVADSDYNVTTSRDCDGFMNK